MAILTSEFEGRVLAYSSECSPFAIRYKPNEDSMWYNHMRDEKVSFHSYLARYRQHVSGLSHWHWQLLMDGNVLTEHLPS